MRSIQFKAHDLIKPVIIYPPHASRPHPDWPWGTLEEEPNSTPSSFKSI